MNAYGYGPGEREYALRRRPSDLHPHETWSAHRYEFSTPPGRPSESPPTQTCHKFSNVIRCIVKYGHPMLTCQRVGGGYRPRKFGKAFFQAIATFFGQKPAVRMNKINIFVPIKRINGIHSVPSSERAWNPGTYASRVGQGDFKWNCSLQCKQFQFVDTCSLLFGQVRWVVLPDSRHKWIHTAL